MPKSDWMRRPRNSRRILTENKLLNSLRSGIRRSLSMFRTIAKLIFNSDLLLFLPSIIRHTDIRWLLDGLNPFLAFRSVLVGGFMGFITKMFLVPFGIGRSPFFCVAAIGARYGDGHLSTTSAKFLHTSHRGRMPSRSIYFLPCLEMGFTSPQWRHLIISMCSSMVFLRFSWAC